MTNSNNLSIVQKLTPLLQAMPLDQSVFDSAEIWGSAGSSRAEYPFEKTPSDYLEFAENDLLLNDQRGDENAFHNAKRSISCAIDSAFFHFGLASYMRRGMAAKLEILREMGVVSPRIVRKLIQTRNLMEHEYRGVGREQAEDALDIAALFTSSLHQFGQVRYDGFLLENSSESVEAYFDWVFDVDGKLSSSHDCAPPIAIHVEAYRKTGVKPTEDGGVCCSWDRRLSEDRVNARGYSTLGFGFVLPENRPLYVATLKLFVNAVLRY